MGNVENFVVWMITAIGESGRNHQKFHEGDIRVDDLDRDVDGI